VGAVFALTESGASMKAQTRKNAKVPRRRALKLFLYFMLFFLIFSSSVAFCHGYNLRPNGKNMCNKKWGNENKRRTKRAVLFLRSAFVFLLKKLF
jgi:cell division protein FtsB